MEYLTIAKVSALSGFSVPTLRFYEEKGLVPPVERDAGGNRLYSEVDVSRVNTIRCLRAAGLSLSEIKQYFALVDEGISSIDRRKELLSTTQDNLRKQLTELQKCMMYLAQKISYYDIAIEALNNNESLPEYKFGEANSIFATEELDILSKKNSSKHKHRK